MNADLTDGDASLELTAVTGEGQVTGQRRRKISRQGTTDGVLALALALVLAAALALIAGKRGDTFDTAIYREYFNTVADEPIEWAYFDRTHFEIGFQLLTRLIHGATTDVEIYFFLITMAGLWCVIRTAQLLRINAAAVLLYFGASLFPMLFLVQMRQGLANCIGFLGLAYYSRGRNDKAWVFLLAAVSIHVSAFLLFLVMVCDWLWRTTRTSLGVWVMVLVVAIYASKGLLYSMNWSRVDYYLNNPDFAQAANILRVSTFKYVGLAMAASWLMLTRKTADIRPLVIACIAAVAMRIVFADNSAFSGRLGASLTFAEIFLVPWLLRSAGQSVLLIVLPVLCAISAYYLLFIEHREILILY